MTLDEIKKAVLANKTVCWRTEDYTVRMGGAFDEWYIFYRYGKRGESCIGLTWSDGVTLNGKPEEFYIEE